MSKSADAFRTISEVAEWLDTPAHVLRFWESKFTQVKPVKRAGGRRYYRPADMRLLGGIKRLLHDDGMTIKGVQKILREHGVKHVSSLCELNLGEDEDDHDAIELDMVEEAEPIDTVVPFAKPEQEPDLLTEQESESVPDEVAEAVEIVDSLSETDKEAEVIPPTQAEPFEDAQAVELETELAAPEQDQVAVAAETVVEDSPVDAAEVTAEPEAPNVIEDDTSALPSFLQNSMDDRRAGDAAEADSSESEVTEATPPSAIIEPVPGALTYLSQIKQLSPKATAQIAPIVEQLRQVSR